MKSRFHSLTELNDGKMNLNALLFLTLGSKYLNLTHNALEENIRSGNAHMIASDGQFSWDEYFQRTKWSDFFIIEPVLFVFYHGLELTIKGLLFLTGDNDVEAVHKISVLYQKLFQVEGLPKDILDVIGRYVVPNGESFISRFLKENQKSIDDLYASLRYPSDKKFQTLNNYIELHYQEGTAVDEYKVILEDIKKLQLAGTNFYRNLTKTGPMDI